MANWEDKFGEKRQLVKIIEFLLTKTWPTAAKPRKTHSQVGADDDGHDDAIDGHCLTEDDADEVLGLDSGRLYSSSCNAGPGCVDSPGGAECHS